MIGRLTIPLALPLLLLLSIAAAGQKKSVVTEDNPADDFLRRGLLTKYQHALLRSNEFLSIKCSSDKSSSCVPQINFDGGQCGITMSVEFINGRPKKHEAGAITLVQNIHDLGIRVQQYPAALQAFGKWDAPAEKAWTELKEVHSKAIAIANSNSKRDDKIHQAKPLLERAEEISEEMAKSAGFVYEGGCGADEDDSQIVRFDFPEKPKAALYILQYDFDACKIVLTDPYDTKKCESWNNIQPSNKLSGNSVSRDLARWKNQ